MGFAVSRGRAEPEFLLKLFHKFDNLCLYSDIKGCCRLVGNKNIGFAYKCHSYHHSLSHTSRKLKWVLFHTLFRVADIY